MGDMSKGRVLEEEGVEEKKEGKAVRASAWCVHVATGGSGLVWSRDHPGDGVT